MTKCYLCIFRPYRAAEYVIPMNSSKPRPTAMIPWPFTITIVLTISSAKETDDAYKHSEHDSQKLWLK